MTLDTTCFLAISCMMMIQHTQHRFMHDFFSMIRLCNFNGKISLWMLKLPLDGSEIPHKQLIVGSLSHYLQGFYTSQMVVWHFLHQQYHCRAFVLLKRAPHFFVGFPGGLPPTPVGIPIPTSDFDP